MVPVAEFGLAVIVIVTAAPTPEAPVPVTTIVPASCTSAVAILPTTAMVAPTPKPVVLAGSVWNFSDEQKLRYLGADGVVLISRQRNRRQNADNRDHDHQFDQGKTLLNSFHGNSLEIWFAANVCAVPVYEQGWCHIHLS